MVGSVAEERIRAKAEAMLRRRFPEARIIHELVLQQGGCRIDLAAVTPDLLALVEIKSERDVLSRLPDQIEAALRVGDLFAVCVAEKVRAKIRCSWESGEGVKVPWGVPVMVETDEGFAADYHDRDFTNLKPARLCNPADRLEMLWAAELMRISGTKYPRQRAKHLICETMTGREIRRAVCRELRLRSFPRADPAVPPFGK
jgi:hypothetical protein